MTISKKTRFEVFKRDNFTCQYCGGGGARVPLEVDHIHPVSRGGSDHPSNLTTACRDCNRGKTNVPVRRTWTFVPGPDGQGEFDGRTIDTDQRFPALWVYRASDGRFGFKADQVDPEALLENPWCVRLTECSRALPEWHHQWPSYQRLPYADTRVIGIYMPVTAHFATRCEMAWIEPHRFLDFLTAFGPRSAVVPYPEDEE